MTEEIRQNNNGFGKDNRGTSLVEIIVALLILVLIFTPAYMAFSAALKLNQASKDKLYAENIAKNAMEIIKYTMDTGGDYKAVDFAPLGFVSSSAVTSTGSAIYTLSECPEGTTKYDVTISILDEEGETLQTKFADMSAFNDTKTALINPSGITGGFDTNVVGYFEQLHTAYRNGLYQEDYERINELNNQLLEDWNYDCSIADMRGEARPPRPTLYEAPTPLRILSKEELADNFLRKELNVTIDKTPGGDYKLNSNVLYKL
jgi:Tfp pilus assembly protein PilV